MGSPAIFNGKYTKLLTNKGILNSDGSIIQFDGAKNYIPYAQFEQGVTTGWSLFNTTLTSGLPTGTVTAGAASLALTATSTNPLSGSYSLQLAAGTSWTAGQGVISSAFTVDRCDLGKQITFRLYYEATAGATNANWSGVLGSQSLAIYIYDVTAGAWVQPTGFLGMNQNSGAGYVTGTFQSSVTSGQQYQIAIIALQAVANPLTITVDQVFVGPQISPIGAVITDWQAYTPTGSWTTNTTYSGYWRRVGSDIEIDANVALSGAPNAATLTINIPSGLSIDTTKLANNTSSEYGLAQGVNAGNNYFFQVGNITSTAFTILYQSAVTGAQSVVNATAPVTWASGNTIHARVKFPIVGWSSNVQMSSDSAQTVITAQVSKSGTQAITGGISTKVTGFTANSDDIGMWDSTNNRFNVLVSGYYRISAIARVGSALVSASYRVNGGTTYAITAYVAALTSGSVKSLTKLNAGDYVEMMVFTGTSDTLSASDTMFQIERLSGPSVLAASDTVAAVYNTTAGNSLSTATIIDFGTKVFDMTNSVTTGASWKYTAPISGKYMSNLNILFNSAAYTAGQNVYVDMYVDGVLNKRIGSFPVAAAATLYVGISGSAEVNLNAGQYIDFRCTNERGATALLNTNAAYNYACITRVGN